MRSITIIFLGIWLLISLSCTSAPTNGCIEDRLAFDIGSGSIKAQSARVNTCLRKIEKVHFIEQAPISFKEDIRSQVAFSSKTQKLGRDFIKKILLKEPKDVGILGVATAAFREAKNGEEYIHTLNKEFGIGLKVITQEEEGKLAFWGAQSMVSDSPQDIVVWDIGGGSQQLTLMEQGELKVIKGKLASIAFKEEVIRSVKKQKPEQVLTPNPLSKKQIQDAFYLVPELLKRYGSSKIKIDPRKKIIGVGGVLSISIPTQVKSSSLTQENIYKVALSKSDLNDQQIGGPYANTDLTNLILVSSLMREYSFIEYKPVRVNLTDGLLVDPSAEFLKAKGF